MAKSVMVRGPFEKMLGEYYEPPGWDENEAIPTKENLLELTSKA